jgi:Arc/MetJ-type ribon-helix-helix transcriptional regulator
MKEHNEMTIHLPPDIESSIQAAVHNGHFASVDAAMTEAASLLLQRLHHEHIQAKQTAAISVDAAQKHKPIWEVAAELRRSVPPEEWAKLPVDGATQHDHYIYGTPKRPTK